MAETQLDFEDLGVATWSRITTGTCELGEAVRLLGIAGGAAPALAVDDLERRPVLGWRAGSASRTRSGPSSPRFS